MALHYADLLRFLEAQRRLPERGSLGRSDLRNRFIDALGTTTVYRAELYSESRLKQIEQTGLQSAYLSRGGSLNELAATFREYGLAYALKKAMRMEVLAVEWKRASLVAMRAFLRRPHEPRLPILPCPFL